MRTPRSVYCVFMVLAATLLSAPDNAKAASDMSSDTLELKRTVAVARFSNETRSGQTFLIDSSGDRIGKQAADILSARLASTNKFLMFERLDQSQVSVEQTLAGIQEQGVSVEYLIVGSVSEFGRVNESNAGIVSRARTQRAYAKVNVRLIEVESGRIIHASEGAGEATSETKRTFGVGSSAGFDQSLTDLSISAAISEVVSNLVESMTAKPWRSYVLAREGELYVVAGGRSQGLTTGVELAAYRAGREVTNPQTGARVVLPGARVGTLRVMYSVGEDEFSEVSFAELVDGALGESYEQIYLSNE